MITTTEKKPKGRPSRRAFLDKQTEVVRIAKNNPELTIEKVASEAGVCRQTASAYLAKWGINKQEIDMFVENRVDIVRSKQKQILDALTPDKLEKAAARDLMVGYGILLDKDRLESGQSTQNISAWTMIVNKASKPTKEEIVVNPTDETVP